MTQDVKKVESSIDQMPTPERVYTETAVHPETGETYTYPVYVFPPEESPHEGLKPAFAYGAK